MTQLWAFLDRIECITVGDVYTTTEDDDSRGTVHYILNVYNYRETRRIPTNRTRRVATEASLPSRALLRAPDFQVPHRFSDFCMLQRRLRKATQSKHQPLPRRYGATNPPCRSSRDCAYCQRVRTYLTNGAECTALLGWRAKCSGDVETRKALLGRLISELVALAREQRAQCTNLELLTMLHQPSSAYVDRSVPGVLRRFLTAQTGETFMR